MTPKELKEFAIKKWEFLVKHPDATLFEFYVSISELQKFPFGCSYCDVYWRISNCKDCPIKVGELDCREEGHPYYAFAQKKTTLNAKVMLDLVKSIKIEDE
jgi:hypothetical protein